jgi:hypothetical protein
MQTLALVVKSVPAVEHTENNDKTETVEEKVLTYKSELPEKKTVEADVSEVAEVDIDDLPEVDRDDLIAVDRDYLPVVDRDDLPAVSQTKESDMIVQREVDPGGPQRIYSIQTGNFERIANTQNYFKSMIREFDGNGVDYVRLVKVGEYYAVRLGKFNGYAAAKKFLTANQFQLPSAIILDNYPSKLISVKKGLDKDGPKKIYAVQTASFELITNAHSHFKSKIREFNGKGVDYVRLVKVGKYYVVRLGKFDGYTAAKKFLMANQSQLPAAIILDNYPLRK